MAEISLTVLVQRLRLLAADRREDHPDEELLRRYVESRDALAFEVLVWRHAPVVLGACRRLLHHAHDVEDVFQATFLALARQAPAIRLERSLSGWLHTVACRLAQKLRARKAECHSANLADVPARTIEGADTRELRDVLDEEVNRLPPHYRQAFVLCHLEGLTNAEAARELGCAKGTIDSRLAWARKRLQSRLTHRGIGLSAVLAATGTQNSSGSIAASPTIELVQRTIGHLQQVQPGLGVVHLGNPTVESLLGETMSGASSRWLAATGVLALALVVGGLNWATSATSPPAPIQPNPTRAAIPPLTEPQAIPPALPVSELAAAPEAKVPVQTHPFSFGGSIRSPGGKPVENAKLYFLTEGVSKRVDCPDGSFLFKNEPIPVHESINKKVPCGWFRLVATSPEFGFAWSPRYTLITRPMERWEITLGEEIYLEPGVPPSFTLRLRESSPFEGQVVDETGKPLIDVVVRARNCEFIKQEENPDGFRVVGDPFIPESREDAAITARTDREGRFRLLLPKDSRTAVRIEHPAYAPLAGFLDHSSAGKKRDSKEAPDTVESPAWVPRSKVKLVKPRTVTIRVVDEVSEQPLAGIKLAAYLPPLTLLRLAEGISDANGNVVFQLPPGRFWLWGVTEEPSLRYFPSGGNLAVANQPEQSRTFAMKVGRRLKIRAIDADTGKGVPNVLFAQRFSKDPVNALDLGRSSAAGTLETLASISRGEFKVEAFAVEGYAVIEPPSEWIKAERGEPIELQFRLRPLNRKGAERETRP